MARWHASWVAPAAACTSATSTSSSLAATANGLLASVVAALEPPTRPSPPLGASRLAVADVCVLSASSAAHRRRNSARHAA